MVHHVIVGSGIAGLSAAEPIRGERPGATITMISEEPHNFYSRPGLAYLLRGDVPRSNSLSARPTTCAPSTSADQRRVEQLLFDKRELVLSDGQRVRYDRLLLATGVAVPRRSPAATWRAWVQARWPRRHEAHLKLARRRKPAVVVGGGDHSVELAEGLNGPRHAGTLFSSRRSLLGDVLDEAESRLVLKRLQHEGVTIHTNTQVKTGARRGRKAPLQEINWSHLIQHLQPWAGGELMELCIGSGGAEFLGDRR